MCCNDLRPCTFAAIWTIIQSLLHLSLCIIGTHIYTCTFEVSNNTLQYSLYLTYFYRNACGEPTLHVIIDSQNDAENKVGKPSYIDDIEFPVQSEQALTTNHLLQSYIILDSVWIICSIALLMGICFRIKKNWSILFFFPWVVLDGAIVVCDLVIFILYGLHIPKTYGAENWLKFIGVANLTYAEELEDSTPFLATTVPSICMTLLFGRFFLIWLINFILFFFVFKAGINAYRTLPTKEEVKNKPQNNATPQEVDRVFKKKRTDHFEVQRNNTNSPTTRIRRWQLYYGTDNKEEVADRNTQNGLHSRREDLQAENIKVSKPDRFIFEQPYFPGGNIVVSGGYEADKSASPSPNPNCKWNNSQNYHATSSSPEPGYYSSSGYDPNEVRSYDSLPSIPRVRGLYRPTSMEQAQRDSYVRELRGQLPWSYFQNRNEAVIIPKSPHLEGMPPVPVPDYTLKFYEKNRRRPDVY